MVGQEKARELVMSGGGDFELVFTVRPEGREAAREACVLTVIGEGGKRGSGWRRGVIEDGSRRSGTSIGLGKGRDEMIVSGWLPA